MAKKAGAIETADAITERQWNAWSNARRAAYILNQYEVLTRNDNEIAEKVGATSDDLAQMLRDYEGLKQWAEYERQLNSILDRDLVADARAVKLFDNMNDPRDPARYPEPPEKIRDQVALLWPFKY